MLATRLLTAAALLPLLLWLLVSGPQWAVFLLLIIASVVSVIEMSLMIQPRLDNLFRNFIHADPSLQSKAPTGTVYQASKRPRHYVRLAFFCATLIVILFSASVYFDLNAGRATMVLALVLAMLAAVFATRGIEAEMARVLGFVLTLVYAGFPWIVIWDLYVKAPSARQVILVLVVVWSGDTGGYFGGRFLGKTKLAPHKSPKKTWEGAATGLSASMAGAFLYQHFFYPEIPGGATTVTLVAILGGIAGQMGDLVESVFKRFTQVKDSGTLLPGHGGLLDRVDAVLFAAPVIWFVLYLGQTLDW
jgi:phosphatidate cytidylyltransferase